MVSGCTGINPAVSTARTLQCNQPEAGKPRNRVAFSANPEQTEQPSEGMSTGKKAAIAIAAVVAACLTRGAVKTQFKSQKALTAVKDLLKNSNPISKDFWTRAKKFVYGPELGTPPVKELPKNDFRIDVDPDGAAEIVKPQK